MTISDLLAARRLCDEMIGHWMTRVAYTETGSEENLASIEKMESWKRKRCFLNDRLLSATEDVLREAGYREES